MNRAASMSPSGPPDKLQPPIEKDVTPLFHWTTAEKALVALRLDRLQSRRWKHFIESAQRMVQGSSWSFDPNRWSADNPVCLVIDACKLPNQRFSINGHRVFLQTQGMVQANFDPNAYLFESTDPDEEFVEGSVMNLRSLLIDLKTSDSDVRTQAERLGLRAIDVDAWAAARSRKRP